MQRSLGFWRSWALVVGTMIGNGIFLLPSVLAPYGSLSLLGWIFAGGGTLFIALMLGSLAQRIPKLGGPYAYTRTAFGDLPGFLVAWGYWISIWSGVAAGAVAFTGYFSVFLPQVSTQPIISACSALTIIWLLTGINVAGVKSAGMFQLLTTLLKLLPLFLIAGCGLLLGDITNVPATNPKDEPFPLLIAGLVMLTMWAFVGVEGVTIPADDVIEPEKTIPRALIAGTLTVTIVYMMATYGVMALISTEDLTGSTSPFADAASLIFGPWGAGLVAAGAIISIAGSLNGQILVGGMISRAIAVDKLFPARFAKLNTSGAPAFALIVSGLLSSALIIMNYSKGLMATFELLILLSTLTTLLPYTASALAEIVLQRRDLLSERNKNLKSFFIAIIALAFSLFAIVGSGLEVVAYGLLLLLSGLPIYYWLCTKNLSDSQS
ncbi:MAG: amino acid permease [Gammaproteobacteria bacterium]|jgi:basic amino acid/polyamine antiporter, APA family|nr:amino acid permease [Gammaproteobacteria bacterium]